MYLDAKLLNAKVFCEHYKISKNKFNVFFVNDKVMHFDWLKITIQEILGHKINESAFREFVSELDMYAKPSNMTSPYFRKEDVKYERR